MQEAWVHSLAWKDPLEKGQAAHPRALGWRVPWPSPWNISMGSQRVTHDWTILTAAADVSQLMRFPAKGRTNVCCIYNRVYCIMGFPGGSVVKNLSAEQDTWWEPRVSSLGQEEPLEEEMATHSSIPWTEEPGGLPSMRLQRVGHDSVTKQQQQCTALLPRCLTEWNSCFD